MNKQDQQFLPSFWMFHFFVQSAHPKKNAEIGESSSLQLHDGHEQQNKVCT